MCSFVRCNLTPLWFYQTIRLYSQHRRQNYKQIYVSVIAEIYQLDYVLAKYASHTVNTNPLKTGKLFISAYFVLPFDLLIWVGHCVYCGFHNNKTKFSNLWYLNWLPFSLVVFDEHAAASEYHALIIPEIFNLLLRTWQSWKIVSYERAVYAFDRGLLVLVLN